ncbi:unnamed protein product [Calypogeia fissa]
MASAPPLYPAVILGDLDRVRSLLTDPGLDVNVRGKSQMVPLHHATKTNHMEITKVLLAHPEIDVNARDKIQRSPLHMACKKGFTKILQMLLDCTQQRIDVNAQAKGGLTPLHLAAHYGHVDAVVMLLDHPDTDLNATTSEEKFTALHVCASGGNEKILTLILEAHLRAAGKDISDDGVHLHSVVNAEDVVKRTPLHYAAVENRVEVVRELLNSRSVDVNAADRDGFTALHLASLKGHGEIVRLLLENRVIDPNVATIRGNQDTLKNFINGIQQNVPWDQLPRPKLADYYAQLNESRSKVTPLHYAVDGNHVHVVTALVEHPLTEMLLENSQRKSALDIAILNKNETMLLTLLDRVWDKFDQCGRLLRLVLNKKGYEEMVEKLLVAIQREIQNLNLRMGTAQKRDVTLIHEIAFAGLDKLLEVVVTIPTLDINAEDSDQQTPLHFAAIGGHTQVVKVLISKPTLRANEEDRYSRTALQISIESERKDIEKLLLERPDVKDYVDRLYRDRQVYVDAANAILVGAALIASVTFAGWLQPPLGFVPYYEFQVTDPAAPPGTFESYASVEQHISTRVFWVCNSLSFFCAIATVIAGAGSVLPMLDVFIGEEVRVVRRSLVLTSVLLVFAVVFVLGAFAAAGFASLPPIVHLQLTMIVTCVIGVLLCVAILGWFLRRLYRIRPSWWRTLERSCWPSSQQKSVFTERFFYVPSVGPSIDGLID